MVRSLPLQIPTIPALAPAAVNAPARPRETRWDVRTGRAAHKVSTSREAPGSMVKMRCS